MKKFYLLAFPMIFTLLLSVMSTLNAYAAEGKVTIKSPADGEVVKDSTVMVEMEIDKGSRGDHIHFYFDGKNLGVVRADKYMLKDLAKGKHKIEPRLASKSHAEIGPKATAEITVE